MPSRSTKISLLLAVDIIFFFIELIAGYAVGSLALVADSFHMLNDVMSLIVSLYAIKLSKSEASPRYSYGWHRAEIVAALINGVFLLALCFSILMEAIERFFSVPEISNAKLVVVVGSLGLASNFLGLFLFHEHSHAHEERPGTKPSEHKPASSETTIATTEDTPLLTSTSAPNEELLDDRSDAFATLYGHPAATRASVVQAAHDIGYGRLLSPKRKHIALDIPQSESYPNEVGENLARAKHPDQHPETSHTDSEIRKQQGAKTGSMNMQALILHVVGDALGNVGVISTGLVIWLSTWKYKFYFDPVISLVITVIIFSSAMPLVRSASFILLQAVPPTVSLESVREDIQSVRGVLSVHELHVWQLSESKIVASVHVWVSRRREYMHVAQEVRKILHDHGIHSCTIQPEFHLDPDSPPEEHLITSQETHCLIPCPPDEDCALENACCPPRKPSPPLVDG